MQTSFNELSLSKRASIHEARQMVSQLIQVFRTAFSIRGAERIVRAVDEFQLIEIADDYPLAKWRNDRKVDEVERIYFKSLTTWSPPIIRERDGNSIADASDRYLFSYNDTIAVGLGTAFLTNGLAISLACDPNWDASEIRVHTLIEDENETYETEFSVPHASHPNHVEQVREHFESQLESDVQNGSALWAGKMQLFPNLVFNDGLQETIGSLSGGLFTQAFEKLRLLDSAAKAWKTGLFQHKSIGCRATPETDQTINMDPAARTFHCAARGADCVFKWHLRLTPGAWRLYYEPIAPGTISVGYLGPKMSTSTCKV